MKASGISPLKPFTKINVIRPIFGSFLWGAGVVGISPNPFHTTWAIALLLLSPLVLLPIAIELIHTNDFSHFSKRAWNFAKFAQLPTALLLTFAFSRPQGLISAALATPWLMTTAVIAFCGASNIRSIGISSLSKLCVNTGLCYLIVGGAWAVCDRLGFRPLNFKAIIVLLTAIHFHYARFLLPVLAGFVIHLVPGKLARITAIGVIIGPPLTAVGITATQLGASPIIECFASWCMAAAGMATSVLYFRAALQTNQPRLTSYSWTIAGMTLLTAMAFSGMYASRFYAPMEWLDIPWMRVLHGTVNALGFSVAGLIGWLSLRRHELQFTSFHM